jgi:hypothetical protein
LAYRIKNAILDTSYKYYAELQDLKIRLPRSVQTLVWSVKTVIFNDDYPGEWLYSRRYPSFTKPRRTVYTWINATTPDVQAPWIFSSEDEGETFTIKSVWVDEYLYPDSATLDNNNERRFVYTWTDKTVGYWEVEVLSDDSITLKSYDYDEYLYAETDEYNFDDSRRSIYTGVSGHVCDDSCTWNIVNECKSSQIIETKLFL